MIQTKPDDAQLKSFCHYGSLAPSVHNIQPWKFQIIDGMIVVSLSPDRMLEVGDPVGRETWISMGACVENIVAAAADAGYATGIKHEAKHVHLSFVQAPTKHKLPLSSIEQRFTDRSRFKRDPVPKHDLDFIQKSWESKKVRLVVSDDPGLISLVSELVSKGIALALAAPEFRRELSSFIIQPKSSRKVGISTASLRLNFIERLIEPYVVKTGVGISKKVADDKKLWQHSAALMFTLSKGDTQEYWFEAGRAYERAALAATHCGLRQSTSAAVVEASDYHTDIEAYLKTDWRLQTVMRIGYGKSKPVFTPRLPLEKLIAT